MKRIVLAFFMACIAQFSLANNLNISNIVVNQTTQMVSFDISWENSWNVAAAPSNWDAVWVFVKFKDCSAPSSTAFTHGNFNPTTASHNFGVLEAMTTGGTGSAVQGAALDYSTGTGIMLRRTTGSGTITTSVSLNVTNLPAAAVTITTNVYGIEMVYVPQGDFFVGDGDGGGAGAQYRFLSSGVAAAPPMQITSAFETGVSTMYYNVAPTTITNIPAAFPKGQYGFYQMKYEISQGLYAEFLNSLGATAQVLRFPGNVGTNRNQTQQTSPNTYGSSRPDRAQNWLSWPDISAFLDWACLRPMTELEFEKSARGTAGTFANEYVWATTGISAINSFVPPANENGTETGVSGIANYATGCCNLAGGSGDAGTGPVRVGIFATSSSTRITAGAGYYGSMELGGNVREYVIVVNGTGTNNTFTRTWGDGSIDAATGNHNVGGGWPLPTTTVACNVTTNFVGQRGGGWDDASATLQTSNRQYCYCTPSITRVNNAGGRGVR